jgi:hypothetical protein
MAVNITRPGFDARAFVFDVALGLRLSADLPLELQVDPLSGMLINLVQMDELLQELEQMWGAKSWNSLSVLLEESRKFLVGRVPQEPGAHPLTLYEIALTEKRGFWLKWQVQNAGRFFQGYEEIRELDTKLFRFRSEYLLHEDGWEQQRLKYLKVISTNDLFSEKIFQDNPGLHSLEIENLTTSKKWSFFL